MRNPYILRTLPILHLFEVFTNFWDFISLGYYLNKFITLRRWWNDFREKSKSKNTKKFTRVPRMWGILTFFVPSQFSSSLEFLKFSGTSYGLGIVEIGSLHLGNGEMISGKIQIQKYEKFHKSMKNMRNPHILRTLPIFHFFGVFKIFWDIIWFGCCLNRFITLQRRSNDFRKNSNPKILKNSQVYEECEESSHCSYQPNSPLLWSF